MSENYYGDLVPGVFVINKDKKYEWGIGQIQSAINDTLTINFENVGKKTINPSIIKLKIININGIS